MGQHMLPLNPPNPHLIKRQKGIFFSLLSLPIPPPLLSSNSTAPASLPASDTCGQKVTRRLIFHGPCTVGRVIQSEFPQSACIYMKSSHSASVTSPALPPESPPPLTYVDTHTPPAASECERERAGGGGAASFMRVKANTIGNERVF